MPVLRSIAPFVLAVTLAFPADAAAQALGLPVRNAGAPRGLLIAADIGVPNDASGLGTTYGASAGIGFGLLGLTATVARSTIEGGDAQTSVGATANFRLIGGPLVPFSATLQAGVGRWSGSSVEGGEITSYSYPLGLGLGLTIASPVVSLKPWLAPRVQWTRVSEAGAYGAGGTTTDAAISGGIDLGFINGITIRGMYDRVLNDGADVSVWSVGLGYSLRIGL
ncbi:MAG: hypothetical protein SGI84_11150 [Gemmatimonadota bacterium]|nr:hypothetical protein [Gemmatimonadota bacterium]